jgi:uncharacterized protein YecE (DUF72 family)
MARIRIGLSGWAYDEWRGSFYPDGLPKRRWLEHAAREFPTLEINSTFYGLATPDRYERWRAATPPGFRFAVKASRYLTHNLRLRHTEQALANFLASGLLVLGDRLGPILWQLPETARFDAETLSSFLAALPRTTTEAAALAAHHDERVSDAAVDPGRHRRLRHVLEPRHESFFTVEAARLLRRHGVALAFSDGDWPYTEEITAGFVYVRLHGPGPTYASAYGPERLPGWAARIAAWHDGGEPAAPHRFTNLAPPRRTRRDVYVYFDNDVGGHAPRDARALRELLAV